MRKQSPTFHANMSADILPHTPSTSTQPAELQQLFIIVCAYFVATLLAYVHSNYNYNNKW